MKTVVIGGGISGLSAAYYASKARASITLIEPLPRLGGVIQTCHLHGCVVEGGPDSFLASKPWALDLARELGLEDQLIGSNDPGRVTWVQKNGRLLKLPEGLMMMVPTRILPVLGSSLVGWRTKLRMGMEYFRRPSGAREDRSVEDFVVDHFGREALDYLAEPLLSGIYGGDPHDLSARGVLPRLVEIEDRYGSLTRGLLAQRRTEGATPGPLFQTFRDGLGVLVDALDYALAPVAERVHGAAEAVERASDGFRVRVAGDWIEADAVIVACPAWAAAPVVRRLDAQLSGLLESIPYNPAGTVALGYRTRDALNLPAGFGFLVPKRERRSVMACTFVHNKFPHRAPGDLVVLRCFSEADVPDIREELRLLLGLSAEPVFVEVARWPRSMAQYTVGHAGRVERMEAAVHGIPGFALAGNAYHGIGIPDCIRSGKEAAERVTGARCVSSKTRARPEA